MTFKVLITISLMFTWFPICCGQDTIVYKKTNSYKSEDLQGFEVYDKVKYGEKHIVFDKSEVKVEWSYFVESIEHQFFKYYNLLDDETVQIGRASVNSIKWKFKMVNDSLYSVKKTNEITSVSGYVKRLIPFEKLGKFYTIANLTKDTIWMADYSRINYDGPSFLLTTYEHPKTSLTNRIYQPDELDELPTWRNGDSLTVLSIKRTDYCVNEPLQAIRTIRFTIDQNGMPHNFEQFEGNFELQTCPFYFNNIIEAILSKSPLVPGKVNGGLVNSACYLHIDMKDAYLNRLAQHPAFDNENQPKKKN